MPTSKLVLLELPTPRNMIASLRNFYDQIKAYVRGLETLGQTEGKYGKVPIILKKLPGGIRKNLARNTDQKRGY